MRQTFSFAFGLLPLARIRGLGGANFRPPRTLRQLAPSGKTQSAFGERKIPSFFLCYNSAMKAKRKIPFALSFFAFLASLAGCDSPSPIRLARPDGTDLEFWITELADSEEMREKGCTYLPGWFGASEYLDSRYEAVEKDGRILAPDVHVTYLLSGYPDVTDETSITKIEITDPTVRVYGLTIGSVTDQIRHRLKGIASSVEAQDQNATVALIQNCTFRFSDTEIAISAPVTNKQSVQF